MVLSTVFFCPVSKYSLLHREDARPDWAEAIAQIRVMYEELASLEESWTKAGLKKPQRR